MAIESPSSDLESEGSSSRLGTSAPSSPPPAEPDTPDTDVMSPEEKRIAEEEEKEEAKRIAARNKKRKPAETRSEREAKAKQLDELLLKSAAFSDILTKKTQVLGRDGTGLDGKTLGEHDLVMAEQPKSLIGGQMRVYQLEGLTWMMEVCFQGMSGILADEMGLGTPSI